MRAKLLARARQAHPSRLGRQGAGRLERPDDRRAGARRASCSIGREWLELRQARLRFRRDAHDRGRPPHALPIATASAKAPATASDYANMIWARCGSTRRPSSAASSTTRALGRRARPALLGRGERRICNLRRRYARRHRASAAGHRRRDAQRQRHHGVRTLLALQPSRGRRATSIARAKCWRLSRARWGETLSHTQGCSRRQSTIPPRNRPSSPAAISPAAKIL